MNTHNYWLLNNNGAGEGVENYYTFSFTYEFTAHQDDERHLWAADGTATVVPEDHLRAEDSRLDRGQE